MRPFGTGRKLWIALVCIQDEKERQTLALFGFLFCLSWWFRDVTSLYIDCGRSLVSQGNWHCIIASRNVKASNLRLHSWAQIFFSTLCLGGMGNNFTILVSDGFRYMVYWHMDLCRLHVIDSWLLNSMITMACVVLWLIVISLGGCWPEVHWRWPLGKGRKLWIAYGLYPGWEGKAGSSTVWFSFLSFLVFSWCDISLHWLWMIFGRSGRLTLHITSRNMKVNTFHLHYFAQIFSYKYFIPSDSEFDNEFNGVYFII